MYKGIDLREATIHDFNNEPGFLAEQFGIEESKEEYSEGLDMRARIFDLMEYAKLVNDKELLLALEQEFDRELSQFSFE
jgi:hypothetical protein